MNNEENYKELGPQPTDKKKKAHTNKANEKNITTNEKHKPTNQNKTSELEPKSELEERIQKKQIQMIKNK